MGKLRSETGEMGFLSPDELLEPQALATFLEKGR